MATKTPAPIDRPLSKAYLREFDGWSTAYPPGSSEPTSLRIMENVWITRDGAAAIRPALRSVFPENVWMDANYSARIVGGFEHFFLNDGRRAILFAARQASGVVNFHVGVYDTLTKRFAIQNLTDPGVDFEVPQGAATLNFTSSTTFVRYLQIDNKIFALSDAGESIRMFFVGSEKMAKKIESISAPSWDGGDVVTVHHPEAAWINSATKNTIPDAETPTGDTLVSSADVDNIYNYAFFYTFENEVGESAPSMLSVIKAQRGWSQWRFLAPDSSGNPTTASVADPKLAMDQLVAILPDEVFNAGRTQGAVAWNLYMATWSDQDAVPPEGIRVGRRALVGDDVSRTTHGWIQTTAAVDVSTYALPLPTEQNRVNYSDPSSARQGLVSGDRLILVNDSVNAAVIRWSSNQPAEYSNFTPSVGGGQKTLSSGNLLIPVSVKLWQNPQSVDTITILCSGVDGDSTSFYMAPASVTGQTDETLIMGFEETTATPGTVSPYGVEVFNNALYHPLDTELMKSTASNYNINHTTVTLDIANMWTELLNKENIISTQHDNRLYYIVHNPDGEELEEGCKGNEIWVYDGAKDTNTWSRWLVQGISLNRLDIGGKLYVALSRPEGIFIFDEFKVNDDVSASGGTVQRSIPWKLETNTQGANRAHDAWCRLQQMEITLGNFHGVVKYGIRGQDLHGQWVEKEKIFRLPIDEDGMGGCGCGGRPNQTDITDFLLIQRDLREWFFFAESVVEEGETAPSYGRVSFVQYRYTPVSVNVGYEFGSIETFEYGRSSQGVVTNTDNGVPQPYQNTRFP